MGHLDRRQKEKEEIRKKILTAAREIGSQEGWHSLTIRKIADKIEYTPPIVYEYFENKEDLIREIAYTGFSMLKTEFDRVRESITDPGEIIKQMSLIHWDFAFGNAELYQLMFSLERPHPNEEMEENFRTIEGTFLQLTEEKESVREMIFSWMCLMNGAISINMKFPNMAKERNIDPRALFSRMINRFLKSL